MKRIILIGAIALLTACGSSDKDAASDATTAPADRATSDSVEGSDDTITVDDFGDMPPKCIELLATYLKQIEPAASEIDWDHVTIAEYQAFSTRFESESTSLDTQTQVAGCDKYNLGGTDAKQFEQMSALAAAEAPGTLGYVKFLASLAGAQTAAAGSLPDDCAGTTAAIEPFLPKGTMQDLTLSEAGLVTQLLGAVQAKCTADEATAFFGRDDVSAFLGS